jgi:hypothetical protein
VDPASILLPSISEGVASCVLLKKCTTKGLIVSIFATIHSDSKHFYILGPFTAQTVIKRNLLVPGTNAGTVGGGSCDHFTTLESQIADY